MRGSNGWIMTIGYNSFVIGKVSDEASGQCWLIRYENIK